MQNTELRPLGAGELLDRAVTLFVRQFVPIVIVLALAIVPMVALQAYFVPQSGRVFSELGRIISASGGPATRTTAEALAMDPASVNALMVLFFLSIVVRLLMWGAIVTLITSAYTGSRITIPHAYLVGARRWLPQLLVLFAFVVIGLVASIPLFIFYLLVIFGVAALATLNQFVATVAVAIVGGLAVLGAFTIVGSWIFMAYLLATVGVVTEGGNPVDAVRAAMSRAWARGMRWRTVAGGIVVFLVTYGGSIPLLVLAAVLTALTHLDVMYFAVLGLGTVLLEGLVATFVVVYAIDVRVRREGWDIIAAETPPVTA